MLRHAELVSASIYPLDLMLDRIDGPWNAVTVGEINSG
jgi:hypothetical protein